LSYYYDEKTGKTLHAEINRRFIEGDALKIHRIINSLSFEVFAAVELAVDIGRF